MTSSLSRTPGPATDNALPAGPEALWVIDASNVLRAYDERTNRVTAELALGRPGDCRWWPVTGGGLIWAFASDGAIAQVDPGAARLTMLPTLGPEAPLGVLGKPYYAHSAM